MNHKNAFKKKDRPNADTTNTTFTQIPVSKDNPKIENYSEVSIWT